MKEIFLFYFFSSLLPQLSNSYSRKPKDKQTLALRPVHTCVTRHDTTAGATTRFFRSPCNQKDLLTHMHHDEIWSSGQKDAATKIRLVAICFHVSQ